MRVARFVCTPRNRSRRRTTCVTQSVKPCCYIFAVLELRLHTRELQNSNGSLHVHTRHMRTGVTLRLSFLFALFALALRDIRDVQSTIAGETHFSSKTQLHDVKVALGVRELCAWTTYERRHVSQDSSRTCSSEEPLRDVRRDASLVARLPNKLSALFGQLAQRESSRLFPVEQRL